MLAHSLTLFSDSPADACSVETPQPDAARYSRTAKEPHGDGVVDAAFAELCK